MSQHITRVVKKNQSNSSNTKRLDFVCGVWKFNIESAGYKELKDVVNELLKRKHGDGFMNIIIRYVSEENLGIHYTFIKKYNTDEEHAEIRNFLDYKNLKNYFKDLGCDMYAGDNMHRHITENELGDYILVNKPINI